MTDLDSHLRETADLWQVDIGETASCEEIRDRCMSQLAKISLESERERIEATKKAHHFEREATVNTLTRIANRATFDCRLATSLDEARKNRSRLALILMDLDRFKAVNDTHGHRAGDAVLQGGGCVLKNLVERPWVCARCGGEEFGIVMPGATIKDLARLAGKLRAGVEAMRVRHDDSEIQLTAGVGGVSAIRLATWGHDSGTVR